MIEVRNGKATQVKPVEGPTPAQIAERAYDLAVKRILQFGLGTDSREYGMIERIVEENKDEDLAALRESVVNPGVVPWWKK